MPAFVVEMGQQNQNCEVLAAVPTGNILDKVQDQKDDGRKDDHEDCN